MAKHTLEISYFLKNDEEGIADGNLLTSEDRIKDAVKLLQTPQDYIELILRDGTAKECHSEDELRDAIAGN